MGKSMKSILKAGLATGILCAVWEIIMASTGWITKPNLMGLFYLVVLIQIAVLMWGLKQGCGENSYGRQVLAGTGISVLAGIFLFGFSLLLTTVMFPDLMAEMKFVQTQMLRQSGRTEIEIAAAMRLQTPLIQALQGFIGTVLTGLLASLGLAVFLRKKRKLVSG